MGGDFLGLGGMSCPCDVTGGPVLAYGMGGGLYMGFVRCLGYICFWVRAVRVVLVRPRDRDREPGGRRRCWPWFHLLCERSRLGCRCGTVRDVMLWVLTCLWDTGLPGDPSRHPVK